MFIINVEVIILNVNRVFYYQRIAKAQNNLFMTDILDMKIIKKTDILDMKIIFKKSRNVG